MLDVCAFSQLQFYYTLMDLMYFYSIKIKLIFFLFFPKY